MADNHDDEKQREADRERQHLEAQALADLSNDVREAYNLNVVDRRVVAIDTGREAGARALAQTRREQALQDENKGTTAGWYNVDNFPTPDREILDHLQDHMGGQGHREALIRSLQQQRNGPQQGFQGSHHPANNHGDHGARGRPFAQGIGRGRIAAPADPSRPRAPSPRSLGTFRWAQGAGSQRLAVGRGNAAQAANVPRHIIAQANNILANNAPQRAAPTPTGAAQMIQAQNNILENNAPQRAASTPTRAAQMAQAQSNYASRAIAIQSPPSRSNAPAFQHIIDKMVKAAATGRAQEIIVLGPNGEVMGYGAVQETALLRIRTIIAALCTPQGPDYWPYENAPQHVLVPAVREFLVNQALKVAFNFPIDSVRARHFIDYFDRIANATNGGTRLLKASYRALEDARNYSSATEARYVAEDTWFDVFKRACEMVAQPAEFLVDAPPTTQSPVSLSIEQSPAVDNQPADPVSPMSVESESMHPTPDTSDPVSPISPARALTSTTSPQSSLQHLEGSSLALHSPTHHDTEISHPVESQIDAQPSTNGRLYLTLVDSSGREVSSDSTSSLQIASPGSFDLECRIRQSDETQDLTAILANPSQLANALFDMALFMSPPDEEQEFHDCEMGNDIIGSNNAMTPQLQQAIHDETAHSIEVRNNFPPIQHGPITYDSSTASNEITRPGMRSSRVGNRVAQQNAMMASELINGQDPAMGVGNSTHTTHEFNPAAHPHLTVGTHPAVNTRITNETDATPNVPPSYPTVNYDSDESL